MVKVTALNAFIHDAHNVDRGDEIEVSESLAQELARSGLVSQKAMEAPKNKMDAPTKNKHKAK